MPKGHLPVRSYLAVPVSSRSGEVIGGLFFGHPRTGRLHRARAERLVVGVAAQAGVAIDNARLYEAAQNAAEERKALLDSERAARSAAERMSEVKDEFLATLSHELRTPLNAILGWAQVLRERAEATKTTTRKGLETIERNARVQTQLIEDLLDMSRITSGQAAARRPAARARVVHRGRHRNGDARRPTRRASALEALLDPAAGPISGDPGRLQQVVWNLLSNAIKFTPQGRQGAGRPRAGELARRDQRHRHRASASRRSSCRTCSNASARATPRRHAGTAASASACRS